jgi:hypothetical protein
MKKALAIFLVFTYVLSATEMREFLKLPSLFEHYRAHQHGDQSLTFAGFLVMHYNDESDHEKQVENDHSLPFKSHASCNLLNIQCNLPPGAAMSIEPVELQVLPDFNRKEEFFYSSFHSSIWQPPKSI